LKYGRLTFLEEISEGRNTQWLMFCDCGSTKTFYKCNVLRGTTTSCGCYRKEKQTKHNQGSYLQGRSLTYRIWVGLRSRCNNPKAKDYKYYGVKGIRVCPQWDDFNIFLLDMGECPSKEYSIDRIDSTGNYEPSNCRWITKFENISRASTGRNKRIFK